MSRPLLDVAMRYVKSATPRIESEEVLRQLRENLEAYIYDSGPREVIEGLLMEHLGNIQPLEKLDVILTCPETPLVCQKRDIDIDHNTLRKKTRTWTAPEDVRLLAGIHRFGLENWVAVAKFVGCGRSRSQCAQRWVRGLDPRISKDSWSLAEEERLISIVKTHGTKGWTIVAAEMGNRSDVQCRYHFLQMEREGKVSGICEVKEVHEKYPIPALPVQNSMMRLPMPMPMKPRVRSNSVTNYMMPIPAPVYPPQVYAYQPPPMMPMMAYSARNPVPPVPPAPPVPAGGGSKLSKQRKSSSQVIVPVAPIIPSQGGMRNASDDAVLGGAREDDSFPYDLAAELRRALTNSDDAGLITWSEDGLGDAVW